MSKDHTIYTLLRKSTTVPELNKKMFYIKFARADSKPVVRFYDINTDEIIYVAVSAQVKRKLVNGHISICTSKEILNLIDVSLLLPTYKEEEI